ncbi:MAG: DUF5684 domain-containing protein [Rikenellaceae bacterium]|nr:DUF5684 domain-containing protein [Rikenellaceae bacterium]
MKMLYPEAWMVVMMNGVNFLLSALILISLCFIFIKMKQPAWKAIIPYYNFWVLMKCLKQSMVRFWISIGCMVGMLLTLVVLLSNISMAMITGQAISQTLVTVCGLLALVFFAIAFAIGIVVAHGLSKSFGHGAGYTTGLILLPFVFYPLLAFGDDRFVEPEDPAPSGPAGTTSGHSAPDFAAVPLTGEPEPSERSSSADHAEENEPVYTENPVEAQSENPLDHTVARVEDDLDEC